MTSGYVPRHMAPRTGIRGVKLQRANGHTPGAHGVVGTAGSPTGPGAAGAAGAAVEVEGPGTPGPPGAPGAPDAPGALLGGGPGGGPGAPEASLGGGPDAPGAPEALLGGGPGGAPPSSRTVLKRGASTSFVLQTSGIALQYVSQVVFARALGVEQFGTYTYAFTWSRLAGSVCHLGGASSSLRLLPEYNVQKRWSLAAGVLRRFRQVAIVVGSLVAIVASVLILAVSGTTTSAVALAVALAFVPVASMIELQMAMTRAFEKIFKAFFPWLVLQPILLIAGLGVSYAMGRTPTVRAALLLTGGSYVATIVVQALWLRSVVPPEVKAASPTYDDRAWAKVTLPIFTSNVVYMVFSRLDIVMVGLLRSPREAGIYAVAMRAGTFVNILETAMASTLAPRISHLYWSDRRAEVEDVTLHAVRWLFIPTLFLTIGLWVFARPILHVFGKGFSAGATVLVLIAVGQLVSVSSGAVGWLMNMTGQQNITAVVYAIVAAITIVGYLVLIPWLGIAGAAIANGGAVVLRNVALNVLARRRLGYRISVLRAFGIHL